MSRPSFFIALGAAFAFLSVAFGAFGAHALKAQLSVEWLAIYQTGVEYQFFHALALLVLGTLMKNYPKLTLLRLSGMLFLLGILLFSGSLYAMALTQIRGLGIITPFGGLAFLLGWANLAWQFGFAKDKP